MLKEFNFIYHNPKENMLRTTELWDLFSFFDLNFPTIEDFFKFMDTYLLYLKTGTTFVFDNSHEFINYQNNINFLEESFRNPLEWVYQYIINNNLNNDSIQLWTGDLNIRENVDSKYKNIVFPKIRFADFPTYCTDINFLEQRTFDKKFICVMGKIRENREHILDFLRNSNIIDNTYYSFNTVWIDKNKPTFYLEDSDFVKDKPIWELTSYFKKGGFEYQTQSFVNLVSETFFYNDSKMGDFNGNGVLYFSEKIFKPITMCQPFILFGKSFSLKKLKEIGFKTFSEFWNEDYDLETNDKIRFDMICNEILNINKLSLFECQDMYIKMISILKHNYYHSFKIRENSKYYLPTTTEMFNTEVVSYEQKIITPFILKL